MQLLKWRHWEILRNKGKLFYVFFYGGLCGGIILSSVLLIILQILFPIKEWLFRILVIYPINYFIGVLSSLLIWNRNEIKFLSEEPPKPKRIKNRND